MVLLELAVPELALVLLELGSLELRPSLAPG